MCVCVSELRETADRVQGQYKMEKQKRKELELKLNNSEEELQDMKTEKDGLERVSYWLFCLCVTEGLNPHLDNLEYVDLCVFRLCQSGSGSGRPRDSAVMKSWKR